MISMTTSIDFEQDRSSSIIKYQSDLRNTLQLNPKLTKSLDLYFSQSYLILEDSPWKISQYAFGFPKYPFFEFKDRFQDIEYFEDPEILYSIKFKANMSSNRVYKRVIQSMIEYLGDMGGLLDIIFFIGTVATSVIVRRQFEAAMVQ